MISAYDLIAEDLRYIFYVDIVKYKPIFEVVMKKEISKSDRFSKERLLEVFQRGEKIAFLYPGDDMFNVLLGTEAGQTAARLLSQHKRRLGERTIGQIGLFTTLTGDGSSTWNMYFHVVPNRPPAYQEHPPAGPAGGVRHS